MTAGCHVPVRHYSLEQAAERSGPWRHVLALGAISLIDANSEALTRGERALWLRLVPDGLVERSILIAPD